MIRCQQCRRDNITILTRYERIRNWLFYKVNYVFFADDFEDIKNGKYTQGYADGLTNSVDFDRKAKRTTCPLN